MSYLCHFQRPARRLDAAAILDLDHLRLWGTAGHDAATSLVDEMAARVFGPCLEIRTEGPVGGEQSRRHAVQRGRTVHGQLRNATHALIPSGQHQVREVDAVIVVQVGEKQVIDIGGADAGLEQTPDTARTTVEEQRLVADLHQIAGAGAVGQRYGRAGAQQEESRHRRKVVLYRHGRLAYVDAPTCSPSEPDHR